MIKDKEHIVIERVYTDAEIKKLMFPELGDEYVLKNIYPDLDGWGFELRKKTKDDVFCKLCSDKCQHNGCKCDCHKPKEPEAVKNATDGF